MLTEIKILMTLALFMYGLAVYFGKNQRKLKLPRFVHFSSGFAGFSLDMYATWLMEVESHSGVDMSHLQTFIISHTIISTVAILSFLFVAFTGITKRMAWHRFTIWNIFIPSWVLAYGSGLYLISLL